MSTKDVIVGALIGVAVTTGYFLITGSNDSPNLTEVSGACNNDQRYSGEDQIGGGTQTDSAIATDWVKHWSEDPEVRINQIIISKIAIDSIFAADLTTNSLLLQAAMNEEKVLTMIASGIREDSVNVIWTDVESSRKLYVRADDVCPNNCQEIPTE